MRTPIQRNDSGAMYDLVEQHHLIGSLENLYVLVVAAGSHRRSGVEAQDAPREESTRAEILDKAAGRRSVEVNSFPNLLELGI